MTWTATATDSNAGPLTFQFNVTPPGGTLIMVKDFNVGTLSGGAWTAQPFVWVPTGIEGTYNLQVVIKDFVSSQTATKSISFHVTAIASSGPVDEKTSNPLVALFSAPSWAAGSLMRVNFQEQSGSGPHILTNWVNCHPSNTMTFEIAGMYANTAYNMHSQTQTGSNITNGPTLSFTTGALPRSVPSPKFTVVTAGKDTSNPVILHNMIELLGAASYPDVATGLKGRIIWYYYANDATYGDVLTRPLQGGGFLTLQYDVAWNPSVTQEQFLRQTDLAGNVVRETNIGVLQQELLAKGAVDGGPCTAIARPAPIGSACIGSFHHDAIQTLPNGWTAAFVDVEKIFSPGTQGDTSGFPVDIIGDMIVVLDNNWQVQWYWDAFDAAGGGNGYAELPVSSTAIFADTCGASTAGCPPILLLGNNIAPLAHDWLHANSLYYWPAPQDGNTTGSDFVWSSRHQDWVFKVDYKDGAGTGNILWRMGSNHTASGLTGDFSFVNSYNDPWPWFSHQHDVGIESGGAGPMTIFDNGNTRVSNPPLGLGTGCAPYDCNSRGMAIMFNESATQVTPVVSFDLGGYSEAMGSAELLADGDYFFENPIVFGNLNNAAYSLEINPTPPAPQVGPADVLTDISSPEHYRGWQMPSLYAPPVT